MKKKKFLAAALLAGVATLAGAFGLAGCHVGQGDGVGDVGDVGEEITDNETPLAPAACEHESLNHVSAKPAACTATGNLEYWYCGDCGKYYSDSALTVETSLAAVTLSASGHNYGKFVYDYAANKYVKTCKNDGTHTVEQEAGTEEYPYLISSVENWVEFANEHSEITEEASTSYWKVTCDLDFSDTTDRVDVFYFSGTIDFDNHKVSGVNYGNTVYAYGSTRALFDIIHSATIKNLEMENSYLNVPNGTTRPVMIVERGDNLLDNVTVTGSVIHAENNASAFVYFVWQSVVLGHKIEPVKLTFNECTNKANITNMGASEKSGFAAAFIGQVVPNKVDVDVEQEIEFINCKNEGTITGYHYASMLIANQCSYADITTLTVENCVNTGKIYAGEKATTVIGYSGNADYLNTEHGANVSNAEGGVLGKMEKSSLTVDAENNFVFNSVKDATNYTLTFVFTAGVYDENGKMVVWGTSNITVDVTPDMQIKKLDFVNKKDAGACTKDASGLYVSEDGNHYVFGATEEELQGYEDLEFARGSKPVVYYTAYNESGEVLAVSTMAY